MRKLAEWWTVGRRIETWWDTGRLTGMVSVSLDRFLSVKDSNFLHIRPRDRSYGGQQRSNFHHEVLTVRNAHVSMPIIIIGQRFSHSICWKSLLSNTFHITQQGLQSYIRIFRVNTPKWQGGSMRLRIWKAVPACHHRSTSGINVPIRLRARRVDQWRQSWIWPYGFVTCGWPNLWTYRTSTSCVGTWNY